MICEVLKTNTSMKTLYLGCEYSTKSLNIYIFNAWLILTDNHIECWGSGTEKMSEMLRVNSTLATLDLKCGENEERRISE